MDSLRVWCFTLCISTTCPPSCIKPRLHSTCPAMHFHMDTRRQSSDVKQWALSILLKFRKLWNRNKWYGLPFLQTFPEIVEFLKRPFNWKFQKFLEESQMEWKFPVRNFWKVCIPHRLSGYQEIPENAEFNLLLEITWKTHIFSMNRKCPQFLCHIHNIIITYR